VFAFACRQYREAWRVLETAKRLHIQTVHYVPKDYEEALEEVQRLFPAPSSTSTSSTDQQGQQGHAPMAAAGQALSKTAAAGNDEQGSITGGGGSSSNGGGDSSSTAGAGDGGGSSSTGSDSSVGSNGSGGSNLSSRKGLRPIFVVGLPRSGSTLIEQILASHPGVWGAGELSVLRPLALRLQEHLGERAAVAGMC